jgi:maleate cis-trans isomerase
VVRLNIKAIALPQPIGPAYGEQLRIGLIALSTDLAVERDFARLADGDATAVFTTRLRLRTPNSEATFLELEKELPSVASLLIPTSRLDVVVFGCTAASMLIGPERITAAVQAGRPGVQVTNPASAVLAAFRALSIGRIAVLTPYTPSVTEVAVDFLTANGLRVTDAAGLGLDLDDHHARIDENTLIQSALSLQRAGTDALFLSCTATRALNVIDRLEGLTGLPVVTSNQATFWHALRLGGSKLTVAGFGRLLASLAGVLVVAFTVALCGSPGFAQSLIPPPSPPNIEVPDWALPYSATHKQVPPPEGFHRPPRTTMTPVGIFDGQTDVGGALVPGSASYDAAARAYTITSAGYNIWYQRDEFRFLWKRMSGDVSFAANVPWPDINEFHDRKVALIVRDSLSDDSREILVAQHGNGMVHIAWRGETGGQMSDMEFRGSRLANPRDADWTAIHATRLGLEKKGDRYQLYVSWQGEALHPEGAPVTFHATGTYYVGIGFTSHLPATLLTAKVTDVRLANSAGRMR